MLRERFQQSINSLPVLHKELGARGLLVDSGGDDGGVRGDGVEELLGEHAGGLRGKTI